MSSGIPDVLHSTTGTRQMSAIGPSRHLVRCSDLVAIGVIVLQNSFLGCMQIFLGALMRPSEKYVGGHMNSLISNRLPL
jgi:hypothetical protein